MLRRVVNKACSYQILSDESGAEYSCKVLLLDVQVSTTIQDRMIVAPSNTELVPGLVLSLDTQKFILMDQQADHMRGEVIRYLFDALLVDNTFNVVRTTVVKNAQGGLSSKSSVTAMTNIAAKIKKLDLLQDDQGKTYKSKYVAYVSNNTALLVGDSLVTSLTGVEFAQVNDVRQITPGLKEVRFENDPRW